jgi:hypothetical protein
MFWYIRCVEPVIRPLHANSRPNTRVDCTMTDLSFGENQSPVILLRNKGRQRSLAEKIAAGSDEDRVWARPAGPAALQEAYSQPDPGQSHSGWQTSVQGIYSCHLCCEKNPGIFCPFHHRAEIHLPKTVSSCLTFTTASGWGGACRRPEEMFSPTMKWTRQALAQPETGPDRYRMIQQNPCNFSISST